MAAAVEEDWESAAGKLSISAPTATAPSVASATPEEGGSAAAATPAMEAMAAQYGVEVALIDALKNARDYALKLESDLIAFVRTKEDPKPPHLVLPPRTSYQRQVAYRLAARFKLKKATAAQEKGAIAAAAGMDAATTNGVTSALPTGASSSGKDSDNHHQPQQQSRVTVLVRVADSAVPSVLLSAIDAETKRKEAAAAVATATAVAATGSKGAPIKLMRRSPDDPRAPNPQHGQGNGGPEKQVRTVEDREREYAQARARIFGTKSPPLPPPPPPPADGSSSGSPRANPAASAGDSGGGGVAAAVAVDGGDDVSAVNVAGGEGADAAAAAAMAAAGEGTAEAGSPTVAAAAAAAAAATTPANDEGTGEAQDGGKAKGKALNTVERDAKAGGDTAAATTVANGEKSPPSSAPVPASAGGGGPAARKPSPPRGGSGIASKGNGIAGESAKVKTTVGAAAAGRRADREAKQAGGAVTSQGPDGTTGFGSGRGKPVPGGGGSWGSGRAGGLQGSEDPDRSEYGRGGGRGGGGGTGGGRMGAGGGRGSRRPPVNAGEWKGQRGMQRNRMAEKSDPDFVRNYDNYRPNFAPYRQLTDPGGGGYGGRGGRGGRDGHGGHLQPPSPRLLHQHQHHPIMGAAMQHGYGQPAHTMMAMPAGMQGQQIRGQMPGQPGVLLVQQQQQQQQQQPWQQQQMDAMAVAAAAAGGAPTAYGAPVPGHPMYAAQGYVDPAQAAAVAAATAAAAAAAQSGGAGATMRGQPQQQHGQQSRHQQQHQHVQHQQQQQQQQAAHHVQHPHTMGYMHQQQQHQQQQHQQQQPGLLPTTPQQQPQQPQQPQGPQQPQPPPQQQQPQTGLLQTPPVPASMSMAGGYMTAQEYYGAQQQAIFYQQDPSMQGLTMGYGVQQPQLPQRPQQQQQQQQPQVYALPIPQQAQQQQAQAQQPQPQQQHPYQHHVYPVGAMQQQPMPQQHRHHQQQQQGSQLHHQGGGGGRGRQNGRGGGTGGGRTVPNRGYQSDFPPLG